jgi:hypothetical protein
MLQGVELGGLVCARDLPSHVGRIHDAIILSCMVDDDGLWCTVEDEDEGESDGWGLESVSIFLLLPSKGAARSGSSS